MKFPERWQSGRSHPPRKRAYLNGYREFESPPLRHPTKSPRIPLFRVDAADEARDVHGWPLRVLRLELDLEAFPGIVHRDVLLLQFQRSVSEIGDELLFQPHQ